MCYLNSSLVRVHYKHYFSYSEFTVMLTTVYLVPVKIKSTLYVQPKPYSRTTPRSEYTTASFINCISYRVDYHSSTTAKMNTCRFSMNEKQINWRYGEKWGKSEITKHISNVLK